MGYYPVVGGDFAFHQALIDAEAWRAEAACLDSEAREVALQCCYASVMRAAGLLRPETAVPVAPVPENAPAAFPASSNGILNGGAG